MRTLRVLVPGGAEVAGLVVLADGWWSRLRGLLGRSGLGPGEGLLLAPCRAVHMLGMRFAIDVAFLTREGRVVAVYPGLAPGRRTRRHPDAWAALELAEGTLHSHGVAVGSTLAWEEAA